MSSTSSFFKTAETAAQDQVFDWQTTLNHLPFNADVCCLPLPNNMTAKKF